MRGLRSTLFLLAALIALGAYIYFVESKREPSSQTVERKDKVFAVDATNIEEVKVAVASGESTTLRNRGGSWQLVAPVEAKADQSEVSGLTTNLASLEIQRVVETEPKDLSQYGLANPRVDVAFKAKGDKDYKHLLLGEKTATGGDLYAKAGTDKKVFLISAFLEGTFNRTTFDLRDKTLLAFERDKVDSLGVAAPGRTMHVVKENAEWKLTAPLQARADFGSIEGLVGRLNTAQVKSIAATEVGDLKKYGLDKPVVTVTVGAGSSRAGLSFGSAAGDGAVYARDLSRPLIFTVESALADDLKKDVSEFRRKDLFEFRPFNANRLEVARGGHTIAYAKAKGSEKNAEEKWRQVTPATQDVDATKMDDLLSKLSNLRAQSFVAGGTKTGLDSPALTVVAAFDEGKKQERVTFGRAGADGYAGRPGEPGAAKLDASELDAVVSLLDELKVPPAPAAPQKK